MKKSLLTLGLIAFVGLTAVSCSTDDSALEDTSAGDSTIVAPIDNGDVELPKPVPSNGK
ncbi:hypothetical protein GN157_08580 [Flavobacterium rakeshii]|uniref:Uncharacterized protein n=1 Tax=Flavobacterium rakeshii TaxID=1038845 RepID=A0A6N8HC23_9FLAO|nr:hypothetical protein [Flavobacterium rakeshii]MEE1896704.1 hypothetical protein [Flavobacterium rakeshii]MUV03762.1 hypothetical protein [Flavobacterium rakeshii]